MQFRTRAPARHVRRRFVTPRRSLRGTVAIVPIVAVFIATAGTVTPERVLTARPPLRPHKLTALTLVGLGDSVPAASGCPCTSFVTLLGARLGRDTGLRVRTENLGTPGQTSAQLQAALDAGPTAMAVMEADVVTITIGANDFDWSSASTGHCGGANGLMCYQSGLASLRANLTAVVERIRALREGRPTAIRLTGYWEIWRDGRVGREWGAAYMRVGDALTREVNKAIAGVAEAEEVAFVDLYAPFKGAMGSDDDTALLAPDGNHPSQSGHQLIADALAEWGLAPLLPLPFTSGSSMR